MIIRKTLNRRLNVERIFKDVQAQHLSGLHYHKKGEFDENYEIVEMVVAHSKTHAYAVKLYLTEGSIVKVQRIKFQWECGGWRSEDTVLKRFPFHFYKCEEGIDEVIDQYEIR